MQPRIQKDNDQTKPSQARPSCHGMLLNTIIQTKNNISIQISIFFFQILKQCVWSDEKSFWFVSITEIKLENVNFSFFLLGINPSNQLSSMAPGCYYMKRKYIKNMNNYLQKNQNYKWKTVKKYAD